MANDYAIAGVLCERCIQKRNDVVPATRRLAGVALCETCYGPVPPFDEPKWHVFDPSVDIAIVSCLCGQRQGHRGRCKVKELRKHLKQYVRELDPVIDESDASFKAAMFIMAPALRKEFGQDVRAIAEWLDFDPKQCELWAANMRKNKLWLADGSFAYAGWFDESGVVEFWLHVLVAEGQVVCG